MEKSLEEQLEEAQKVIAEMTERLDQQFGLIANLRERVTTLEP